jgi:hypothetical protein
VVGTKTHLLMLHMMSMISAYIYMMPVIGALYGTHFDFVLKNMSMIVSSHKISKSCFYFADLLFHLLSEPELGNNMSTIGELSKRLLSRRPNVEPILSQQFLQHAKHSGRDIRNRIHLLTSMMRTVVARVRQIVVLIRVSQRL